MRFRVGRARARPPQVVPLRSHRWDAQRPRRCVSPKCAPPKRDAVHFRSFGFTGGTSPRPVTASARSHCIPSHSDLMDPLDRHRAPRHADPRALRRRASAALAKAMGPTWRSLTPRGEWLPPKRNTAGVASRKKVTGSDNFAARSLAYPHKTNAPRPPPIKAAELMAQKKVHIDKRDTTGA